jgi:hypothetical protein
MREPPAERLDLAWPGIGRAAIQQVADVRTFGATVGTSSPIWSHVAEPRAGHPAVAGAGLA